MSHMGDMRSLIDLVSDRAIITERAAPAYYAHITALKNVPGILKKGLVPLGGKKWGSYESSRWYTLNGVYAADSRKILNQYIQRQNYDYAVVLLSISERSAIPDEDIIENLLTVCLAFIVDVHGIATLNTFHPSDLPEYFEENPEFDEAALWKDVAQEFHKRAGGNEHIPYDAELLDMLVDYWKDYECDTGGENDPHQWMIIKDRVARKYRKMRRPDNAGHSIRITDPISYSGRNRIVAVITVDGDNAALAYGSIPNEAREFVTSLMPVRAALD